VIRVYPGTEEGNPLTRRLVDRGDVSVGWQPDHAGLGDGLNAAGARPVPLPAPSYGAGGLGAFRLGTPRLSWC